MALVIHGVIFRNHAGELYSCLGIDVQAGPVVCAPSLERFGLDDGSDDGFPLGFAVSLCDEGGLQPSFVALEQALPVCHERHALAKRAGFVPRQANG